MLAIDAGQPPLSSTARVLINVTDVIKDPPSYDTEQFVFYIREGGGGEWGVGKGVERRVERGSGEGEEWGRGGVGKGRSGGGK